MGVPVYRPEFYTGGAATPQSDLQTRYEYDAAGNLIRQVYSDQSDELFNWDALNRTQTKQSGQFTTDQGVITRTEERVVYDSLGQVATEMLGDALHAKHYAYDFAGRLIRTVDAEGGEISYQNDRNGQVTRKIEKIDTVTRDASGKLQDVIDTSTHTIETAYRYDRMGREVERNVGGVDTIRRGDVISVLRQTPTRFDTVYNAHGDIVAKGTQGTAHEFYTYDTAGRVVKSNKDNGAYKLYVYDANGNLSGEIGSAGTQNLATANAPDLLTAIAAGSKDYRFTQYHYDARNQQVRTDATGIEYEKTSRSLSKPDWTNPAGWIDVTHNVQAGGQLSLMPGGAFSVTSTATWEIESWTVKNVITWPPELALGGGDVIVELNYPGTKIKPERLIPGPADIAGQFTWPYSPIYNASYYFKVYKHTEVGDVLLYQSDIIVPNWDVIPNNYTSKTQARGLRITYPNGAGYTLELQLTDVLTQTSIPVTVTALGDGVFEAPYALPAGDYTYTLTVRSGTQVVNLVKGAFTAPASLDPVLTPLPAVFHATTANGLKNLTVAEPSPAHKTAVWNDVDAAGNQTIYYAEFNPAGGWASPTRIGNAPAGIAIDGLKMFTGSKSDRVLLLQSGTALYAMTKTAAGVWSAPQLVYQRAAAAVNVAGEGYWYDTQISQDANGNLFFGVADFDGINGSYKVMQIDPATNALTEIKAYAVENRRVSAPSIGFDNTGRMHLGWVERGLHASVFGLYGNVVMTTYREGTNWTAAAQVYIDLGSVTASARHTQFFNQGNDLVLVWEATQGNHPAVWYSYFDTLATQWVAAAGTNLHQIGANLTDSPKARIKTGANGVTYLLKPWTGNEANGLQLFSYDVLSHRWTVQPAWQIGHRTDIFARNFDLDVDRNGNMLLLWDYNNSTFYRRYQPAVGWSAEQLLTPAANQAWHSYNVSLDARGDATLLLASGGQDLLSYRYTMPAFTVTRKEIQPYGIQYSVEKDAAGNAVMERVAISTKKDYNAFGEVVAATDAKGQQTRYQYTRAGWLAAKVDPIVRADALTHAANQNDDPTDDVWSVYTTTYRYDALGRLLAQRDGGGTGPLYEYDAAGHVTTQYTEDRTATTHGYDAYGNRVRTQVQGPDGLRQTAYAYDRKQRLVDIQRFVDVLQPYQHDTISYDARDREIRRGNALGQTQLTRYDAQDRVVHSKDSHGIDVEKSYTTFTTGDTEVTTYYGDYVDFDTQHIQLPSKLRSTLDSYDYFGLLRQHIDLSGRHFLYSYDQAGQLWSQWGIQGSQQNIAYHYYQNGWLKQVQDVASGTVSEFVYDANGNRTQERYATGQAGALTYQQWLINDYDALNRIEKIDDPNVTKYYHYDAHGNIRRIHGSYVDVSDRSDKKPDYWYSYDTNNRVRISKGALINDAVLGPRVGLRTDNQSVAMDYYADGTRKSAGDDAYIYSAGRLKQVENAAGRVVYEYDPLGRVSKKTEFGKKATKQGFEYPEIGVTLYEYDVYDLAVTPFRQDKETFQTQVYDSGSDSMIYVTQSSTSQRYDPEGVLRETVQSTVKQPEYRYYYEYEYWDTPKQTRVQGNGLHEAFGSTWRPGFTEFAYDANGHIRQLSDKIAGKTLNFSSDYQGQIHRKEEQTGLLIAREQQYYYLNGLTVADIGNFGDSQADYAEELRAHQKQGNEKPAYTQPVTSADFDQQFSPLNSSFVAGGPQMYQVNRTGETLRSIALAYYGDSNLWYLLAEANGKNPDSPLKAGETVLVPKALSNRNTAETFRPQNQAAIIGNTLPQLPEPPPPLPGKGVDQCKQVVVVLVQVAVTAALMPTGVGAFTAQAFMAGFLGSVAGQFAGNVVGIQTGINLQDALISGAASFIASGMPLEEGGKMAQAFARATTQTLVQASLRSLDRRNAPLDGAGAVASIAVAALGANIGGGPITNFNQAIQAFAINAAKGAVEAGLHKVLDQNYKPQWGLIAGDALAATLSQAISGYKERKDDQKRLADELTRQNIPFATEANGWSYPTRDTTAPPISTAGNSAGGPLALGASLAAATAPQSELQQREQNLKQAGVGYVEDAGRVNVTVQARSNDDYVSTNSSASSAQHAQLEQWIEKLREQEYSLPFDYLEPSDQDILSPYDPGDDAAKLALRADFAGKLGAAYNNLVDYKKEFNRAAWAIALAGDEEIAGLVANKDRSMLENPLYYYAKIADEVRFENLSVADQRLALTQGLYERAEDLDALLIKGKFMAANFLSMTKNTVDQGLPFPDMEILNTIMASGIPAGSLAKVDYGTLGNLNKYGLLPNSVYQEVVGIKTVQEGQEMIGAAVTAATLPFSATLGLGAALATVSSDAQAAPPINRFFGAAVSALKGVGASSMSLAKLAGTQVRGIIGKAFGSEIKGLQTEIFKAPSTGKSIEAAVSGNAAVPLDKVNMFARGKVASVSDELKALQQLKQSNRKLFDADPNNAKLLDQLKSQRHNFERSVDMQRHLENIGLSDTPANNRLLIEHLLQVGNKVTPDNRVWVPSVLKGPNGSLKVESTWKILADQRAYLSTFKLMPIKP